jgi:hypothetical protein
MPCIGFFCCLGLIACTPAASEVPTNTPPVEEFAATDTPEPTEIQSSAQPWFVVTFDGETCEYTGPSTLVEGNVVLELRNLTDRSADLIPLRLDANKTWQDVLDFFGEPGSDFHKPDWLHESRSRSVPDNPDALDFAFQPGLHGIFCVQLNTAYEPGNWVGSQFEVIPATSD